MRGESSEGKSLGKFRLVACEPKAMIRGHSDSWSVCTLLWGPPDLGPGSDGRASASPE